MEEVRGTLDEINCPRCGYSILSEHKDLSCHAHNTENVWRSEAPGEIYSVIRRIVIEEDEDES